MERQDLRKAGLKVTSPRLKVLQILEHSQQRHMSAEAIYRALLDGGEELGLATVYRVLTQFERAGLVSRNNFEGGQAVFERRADNLQALVDRIANDEGADSAVIDQQIIEQAGNLFDFHCDDIFYFNKGRLYANYLLLRELGRDFDSVIKEKGLTNAWNGMVETFRIAAQLEPWIVWNGYPDALLIPNHLAAQGFYLLRARTQLREISSILLK